jgi:DNA phosphorothioation-associated putative methyltransferase
MFDTAKTAIGRKGPSVPARRFVAHIKDEPRKGYVSVLDWGCGRGADVDWFNRLQFDGRGYDPIFRPRVSYKSTRPRFNYVTCFYVLNVIPTKIGRVRAIKEAVHHLAEDGQMFIAVRAKRAIDKLGNKWTKHRDGYRTSKNTFQHGFTDEELKKLVKSAGMCYTAWSMAGFVGAIATHRK